MLEVLSISSTGENKGKALLPWAFILVTGIDNALKYTHNNASDSEKNNVIELLLDRELWARSQGDFRR